MNEILYTELANELKKRSVRNKETGCFEWQGANVRGYGHFKRRFWFHLFGTQQIHRLVMSTIQDRELEKDEIVMHVCDTPSCWNPKHLKLGTAKQNTRDAVYKGRMSHGEYRYNAKLTDDIVLQLRKEAHTMSQRALAKKYGITQTTCKDILHFRRWAHVGGPALKMRNWVLKR